MIRLKGVVYRDRSYLGKLVVEKDGREYEFKMSAQAGPDTGVPDPGVGRYRLNKIADVPTENQRSYGPKIFYFETDNGNMLALHGGDTDEDNRLLSTEGSLRISNEDLGRLAELIQDEYSVMMSVIEEKAGLLSFFTLSRVGKRRISRTSDFGMERDSSRYWMYDNYRSGSVSDRSTEEEQKFGGGESGGGGASAGWRDEESPPPVGAAAADIDESSILPVIADPFSESENQESSVDEGDSGEIGDDSSDDSSGDDDSSADSGDTSY